MLTAIISDNSNESTAQDPILFGEELRSSLARDGFVKIPNVISTEALQKYRSAATELISLAREGQWPHLRTLPKQFPPWNASDIEKGIWGVQHLLHPDMPAHLHSAFAESYFDPALIAAIKDLLQCSDDDLVLELYNMLIRPDHDFQLCWHRDVIPPTASAAEELSQLAKPMVHAQWNLALYKDTSLVVVPGSHRRARTEIERGADPYEDELPGQQIVRLDAGDVLFYDNNILHRGVYDSKGGERMTLHGTMGLAMADPERARNILQHGIGTWVARSDFSGLPDRRIRELALGMQQRLVEMGSGDEVAFAHDD
nr:hypothetical protein CFP56_33776 [Quercus suber]